MADRKALQAELEQLIGSRNVYYQPPENVKMNYPAIVYDPKPIANRHADNIIFSQAQGYILTYITPNPVDPNVKKLSLLPTCRPAQHYISDNLYHDVFEIYY